VTLSIEHFVAPSAVEAVLSIFGKEHSTKGDCSACEVSDDLKGGSSVCVMVSVFCTDRLFGLALWASQLYILLLLGPLTPDVMP
jgi:hypothetical protein